MRGINLGSHNRIAMPALRETLTAEGFGDVRTYVQSGNIVLSSDDSPDKLARRVGRLIADQFDLEIAVVVRTRDELAEVVKRNPLAYVAVNPKRYQVTFLERELDAPTLEKLAALALPDEQFVAIERAMPVAPFQVTCAQLPLPRFSTRPKSAPCALTETTDPRSASMRVPATLGWQT